ncbi:hypothetical protein [Natrinema sp. 1APR25-10V2]|uniref:hypothetical protein n=1 Tax=Natrinema sp. 1APR25-10V2 TaxID=2951081 RepID=UPI0028763100|nr:hypothetical protein [Natrinema sp. 1APR25-10V2]MDS0474014.1 hypothetical protein [Natrinema sp. 1APR25-10V2]
MADQPTDREPIVSEGQYAIVDAAESESAAYRLVSSPDDSAAQHDRGVPIDTATVDDLEAVVSRLRGLETDTEDEPETVELTCHECGKTWTYTGGDEHASCPNCETEVPVEGIGP